MDDLLPLEDAKDALPTWQRFCTLGQRDTEADAEPRLEQALRDAEGELRDYVQVQVPADLTPRLRRYLLHITKYNIFDLKNSAEDYDTKPTALRRYERTIDTLESIRDGTQPDPRDLAEEDGGAEEDKDVNITAEPRRFRESWLPSC